jgi:hypothetical protein
MLEFANYFSEAQYEEIKDFDKTNVLYVTNTDKDVEEATLLPAFGTPEYYNQVEASAGKGPEKVTSIRAVAEMINNNLKSFIRSTNVVVTNGGDRILTTTSTQEK